MRGGRRGECLSSSVLNQVLPSEAHWKEPQECSFGDSFRKAPKGHWRKARGRAHFPALAKVRQIIESLFLGFPVFHCTEEDGGRGGGGGGRMDEDWMVVVSIPLPAGEGEGWPRPRVSFSPLWEALGRNKERMTGKQTCWTRAFTNTRTQHFR